MDGAAKNIRLLSLTQTLIWRMPVLWSNTLPAAKKICDAAKLSIDSMKMVGDSIGRQYYREVSEGNFRSTYGLTKEDTVKIMEANITEYNIDSLYEVAPLMQKQKVIVISLQVVRKTLRDSDELIYSTLSEYVHTLWLPIV